MSLDRAARRSVRPAFLTFLTLLLSLWALPAAAQEADAAPDTVGHGTAQAAEWFTTSPGEEALSETSTADTIAPGAESDSLGLPDTESAEGEPADSLAFRATLPDTAAPRTLARDAAAGPAAGDSLGSVASARDSLDVVPAEPRDPYALGVRTRPSRKNEFLRPWAMNAWERPGLGPVPPALPGADPSGVPFGRSVAFDDAGERIRVVTNAGDHLSWTSFVAPVDAYVSAVAKEGLDKAWQTAVTSRLGKGASDRGRGFLDIDIPMPLPGPFVRAIGPGANLKVRGSERITFGGQTSYIVEALPTESAQPSRFPQLDMQQQLTVNLEGTIGRKIHVYVDHRSGGDTFGGEGNDQIRVRYDGDEDEIIQKIELGQVNLSLPGTEFVSYSGFHEGLFGAKMTAKVGKLDLVTIASKEEGKSSSANFTGTSESDSLIIKDISYKAGTFFIIDEDALKFSDVGVKDIKVYLDDRIASNDIEDGAQAGVAYLDDPPGAVEPAGSPRRLGNFVELLETEDYYIPRDNELYQDDSGFELGLIVLTSPVPSGKMLAVSYTRTQGETEFPVGGSDGDSLRLKLIKQYDSVIGTSWEPTRRYELKNVYDLGATDIPEEGFELVIRRASASGEDLDVDDDGTPLVRVLGLDTDTDIGIGASEIDPAWIDLEAGILLFPHFTPFCPDYDTTGFYYAPGGLPDPKYYADEFDDSEKNCAVYAKETFKADDDDYYFVVKYDRPKTSFYLGQINIIENSEVVRLNGVRLTRGSDYTIYYPAGQLTILAEEAKEPDARITVEYDYKPFGVGGEKTLLGTRGVYNWSENVTLGTTWMYQSKGTPEDRPRLGEEPSRTIVGDVNMSADFKPDLMTSIVDAIPFIDTDVESRLKVAAEAAVSIPDPNTKGFVAIDDMEGAENTSMLGVSRRLWVPTSEPVYPVEQSSVNRMNIDWYNPDRKVHEGDLHPELPDQEADDSHTVLEMAYDSVGAESWAGLMRLLSKTGADYSDYEFLEVWLNDGRSMAESSGRFNIDLGTLNEDFYPLPGPNGILDTEDVDNNGFDADEDVGLDGVAGADGAGVAGDDGDDDYQYEYGSDDYSKINGTEQNEYLDTEDLNGNGYIDSDNRYWHLELDLSDTTYLVQDNSEIVAGNNWRLYRIPLRDADAVSGMSAWTSIKSARVWIDGFNAGAGQLMVGSMDIVGSQWETEGVRDDSLRLVSEAEMGDIGFRIETKNTKEDVDYVPPFDPGLDEDTNLPKREQSLSLLFENLPDGYSASARKVFYSEEDYTSYQAMEFYVHGDASSGDGTVFFVRLGRDSLNYYEYSLEVRPGWVQDVSSGANLLSIPFTDFTDLKIGEYATRDTVSIPGDTLAVQGERLTRVGWPSLSRISRLTIGVRNERTDGSDASGEVWLDDIRLSDVRKDIGWAERATIDARFADVLNLDLDVRHVDSEFHTLKQTTGSGRDNLTYNVKATLNADRFVSGLGISTPVTVNWKRSISRPKFSTGSDIVLDSETSEKEKTETLNRSVAVSLSRKRQSPDFLTHLLVDGLSLRASVAENERLSPTKADTSRTIRGRVSYRYSPEKHGIRVFRNTQLFLKPTSIRINADTHLIHSRSYDISSDEIKTRRTDNYDKKLNADANIDFQFLDNLRTSHSVGIKRDLEDINRIVYGLNTGVETQRRYSNNLNFSPKFGSWFAPQYSFSSTFTDNHGPEQRRSDDPFGIRNVRASNTQDVRASFDVKRLFGTGGGSRATSRRRSSGGRPQDRDRGESGDDERTDDPGAEGDGEGEGGDREAEPGEGDEEKREDGPSGPGLGDLVRPILTFVRNTDALDARYSIKRTSQYDRITWTQMPGWAYKLGLSSGEGADDRSEEHTLTLDSGVKLASQIRVKGSYKRTQSGRWYKNSLSDTVIVTTETRSVNETTKGSLTWGGIEKVGALSGFFSSVRARSGAEYKRSYGGPAGHPSTRGRSFGMNPIVSVDATFKNGLTSSFSWDRRRNLGFSYSGAGSVTEDRNTSMSLTLNYRFSAPQGLRLPFFGEKLKFQSNLETTLTVRTSSNESRTALDEAGLLQVNPTSSTRDLSVTADLTYSFSRSVSGGLSASFKQDRDEKRDQTRRTIGVHLTAEFKF